MNQLPVIMHVLFVLLLSACSGTSSRHTAEALAPGDVPMPMSEAGLAIWAANEGFQAGVAQAQQHIAQDDLVFLRYGFIVESLPRSRYQRRYQQILLRHRIRFVNAGCELPPPGEKEGHDQRMAQEVVRRHGEDFWTRVDQEARQ